MAYIWVVKQCQAPQVLWAEAVAIPRSNLKTKRWVWFSPAASRKRLADAFKLSRSKQITQDQSILPKIYFTHIAGITVSCCGSVIYVLVLVLTVRVYSLFDPLTASIVFLHVYCSSSTEFVCSPWNDSLSPFKGLNTSLCLLTWFIDIFLSLHA